MKESNDTKCNIVVNTETDKMTIYIVKTSLKTFICVLITFYFFMAVCMGIAPSFASNIWGYIGTNAATMSALEQQYKKHPNENSLYNIIIRSVAMNDNARIIKYVPKLVASDSYQEFAEALNKVSIESVSLDRVAFVYDLDSYLNSLYVQALYQTGYKDSATNLVYLDAKDDNTEIYTRSTIPLMSLIYSDTSMLKSEKITRFAIFSNSEIEGRNFEAWLQKWLADIEYKYESEDTLGRIFNVYMQIKMNTCLYQYYDILGNDIMASEYDRNVNQLKQTYQNMVN